MASEGCEADTRPASAPGDPRVGLALGGGGLVGHAYHAGALAGLAHDVGWDPRSAEVVVGTSAGALTGALLRSGVAAFDLAGAFGAGSNSYSNDLAQVYAKSDFPPMDWRALLRPRLPTFGLLRELLHTRWFQRPWTVAHALLRGGSGDPLESLAPLERWTGRSWPDGDLRIASVRADDAQRFCFRSGGGVPLLQAVAASCAVPGYFHPVNIDGRDFIDGGIHSPTNADLLVDDALDLVIIVSPLSTKERPDWTLNGLLRRAASRCLRDEVAALERRGASTVVVEPARDATHAMGPDLMRPDVCPDTMREAFLDVGRQPRAAERLREFFRVDRAA